MEKMRAGIVGCGLIAQIRHIPALMKMRREVELVAVCDRNEDLARKVASDFGIRGVYGNVTDMMASENLRIVDICVPPQAHASVALEAIEAGANVIMEKPMALRTVDCDKMISAADKQRKRLCVIHNNLFHPPFLKGKKMISEGAIGDFVGMRIYLSTPRWDMLDQSGHWYHKLPGGVIGETGPHIAYMSLAFLKHINSLDVFAQSRLKLAWAPFDEFRLELDGETGYSSVGISYSRRCWSAIVDLIGSEGALHLDLNQMTVTTHRLSELKYGPIAGQSLSLIGQLTGALATNGWRAITKSQLLGTEFVMKGFLESIQNDKPPPVSGSEGRDAVELMERIVTRYNEKYGLKGVQS